MATTHGISLRPQKMTAPRKAPTEFVRQGKQAEPEDIDEDVLKALEEDESPRYHPKYKPLTKTGKPDRRFKGQRELMTEEVINPAYVKPRRGTVLTDGTHVTLDGKPDRRFKENRAKSEDQVMAEWAERMYETYAHPIHH